MEEEEKGRVNGNNSDEYYGFCQCYAFVKEALNAILKCLGLESSQEICSEKEKEKEKKKNFFICHEDGEQINPVLPPSTETETDSDPFLESLGNASGRRRGRTPPRPPVSGGPDPQTNSNPSF